jgi:hypothetical protein
MLSTGSVPSRQCSELNYPARRCPCRRFTRHLAMPPARRRARRASRTPFPQAPCIPCNLPGYPGAPPTSWRPPEKAALRGTPTAYDFPRIFGVFASDPPKPVRAECHPSSRFLGADPHRGQSGATWLHLCKSPWRRIPTGRPGVIRAPGACWPAGGESPAPRARP